MKQYLPTAKADQAAFTQDAINHGYRNGVPPIETVRNLHKTGMTIDPAEESRLLTNAGEMVKADTFQKAIAQGMDDRRAMIASVGQAVEQTGGHYATTAIEKY